MLHILTSGMEFEVLATKNPFFFLASELGTPLLAQKKRKKEDNGSLCLLENKLNNQLIPHLQPQNT